MLGTILSLLKDNSGNRMWPAGSMEISKHSSDLNKSVACGSAYVSVAHNKAIK